MPSEEELRRLTMEMQQQDDQADADRRMARINDAMKAIDSLKDLSAAKKVDEFEEAIAALQDAKKHIQPFEHQAKTNTELVEMLKKQFRLSQNLDRIEQMQEPRTFEAIKEEEDIEDLEVDTENLVSMLEEGFSNQRGAATISDITAVENDAVSCEVLPNSVDRHFNGTPDKPMPKLRHSIQVNVNEIDTDAMLAAREARMPEILKQREQMLKKLSEKAEENRRKADEWVRDIAKKSSNKVSLLGTAGEVGEIIDIKGADNIERFGLENAKEGSTFALQLVQISQSNGIPTYSFKLVDITKAG